MPAWLQTLASWNPLSALVLACRELFGNPTGQLPGQTYPWPLENPILYTLISCAVLLVIFVPLATRRYRTTTGR